MITNLPRGSKFVDGVCRYCGNAERDYCADWCNEINNPVDAARGAGERKISGEEFTELIAAGRSDEIVLRKPTPTPPDAKPTGICSAHRDGEDPSCRLCYPDAQPREDLRACESINHNHNPEFRCLKYFRDGEIAAHATYRDEKPLTTEEARQIAEQWMHSEGYSSRRIAANAGMVARALVAWTS